MSTNIDKDKVYKVAHQVSAMAHELGKQFQTGDHELAAGLAELQTRMTTATDPERVEFIVNAIIEVSKKVMPGVDQWAFICLNVNWLSWAWHEQHEEELAQAWADAWYKIHNYTLDTLKGDDLNKYVKLVD